MPQINSQTATAQAIAASGLRAQQARMRIIAENIANADSTARSPGGDPYRRQNPIFEPHAVGGGEGVRLVRVEPDQKPFKSEYNPGHPGADATGYVKMPNVETLVESLDMRAAQRAYEANLNVIETARALDSKTLEILKR